MNLQDREYLNHRALDWWTFHVVFLFIAPFIFFGGCEGEESSSPLKVTDFRFDGPLGSGDAGIQEIGENHFRIDLGAAPGQPGWPNKLNFEITGNAKGNNLTLDVHFAGGPGMSFNEYFQSWSYDGEDWTPIDWEKGFRESPQFDRLHFPEFEQERVLVGTQVPFSFRLAEEKMQRWSEHPDAELKPIGESLEGRPLYRLVLTASDSPHPQSERWVHYVANQHPGEHNSQWRMAGMVDWILSEEGRDYRERSITHVAFYMSPDAPGYGWYRVNAEGVDMNRSYRPEGADKTRQAHEAWFWQRDLETIMEGDSPVTTIWAMHTWQGRVEPLLRRGPEFGTSVGDWEDFRQIMQEADRNSLIKPLALREGEPSYGYVSWGAGPARQFGITAVLCEGGSTLRTKEENIESGVVLIRSIAEFYSGTR